MKEDKTKPDPYKVFKAIADIITARGGVKVTVKSVKVKERKANSLGFSSKLRKV
ncbi:hypothetical protein GCM10023142_11100 [Anaerocolumna aminovalerica]|uniref:Uncharacterized protein n=1 Tax=Anaerocolumna aminovalerica TaxID=1527 RepID=A0A1I5IXU2_9FIRM|nr:hypothetical protein [Anaerocolumna aminovalerica]SFO65394.1 hypothetical protein SAMN04489757_1576 [Anaerocolumna aminovalerica]